jgi:beta-barrel assembly-enhancing protease
MMQTNANYFDGKTSKPQSITIIFNKHQEVFSFEDTSFVLNQWSIKNLTFEQVGNQICVYNKDGIEFLAIDNLDFINELNTFRSEKKYFSTYEKLINLGFKKHLFIAASISLIIIAIYIFALPWIGEKSAALIPESFDNEISITSFDSIHKDKTTQLNLFAKKIDLNNSKKLKFIVIQSPEINAFAMPDGTIVVYTGIIESMENYEEMVALLGHEAAHVNNRHAIKMMCRNLAGYLFISAVLGDVNGVASVLIDNANTLRSLSFSREFETEADMDGLSIMIKNKVNPKGMLDLFNKIDDKKILEMPHFLSTHPITKDRMTNIKKAIRSKNYFVENNIELNLIFNQVKTK